MVRDASPVASRTTGYRPEAKGWVLRLNTVAVHSIEFTPFARVMIGFNYEMTVH